MLSQRELTEAGRKWEGIGTEAKPGAATAAASQVWVGSIASGDQTHCCPQNNLRKQGEGHSGAPPRTGFSPSWFWGKIGVKAPTHLCRHKPTSVPVWAAQTVMLEKPMEKILTTPSSFHALVPSPGEQSLPRIFAKISSFKI